jgi:Fe2+ or Zn2+ uptake regulation protein
MSTEHPSGDSPHPYDETIALGGFRLTRQRREVYDALMDTRDHPTAVQVFMRVQKRMPTISLATVYNCLETMAQCGLVRQVNFDRGPSRFCANQHRHAHFICTQCSQVQDVELPDATELDSLWHLPDGCVVSQYEFTLRGICRSCTATADDPSNTKNHS